MLTAGPRLATIHIRVLSEVMIGGTFPQWQMEGGAVLCVKYLVKNMNDETYFINRKISLNSLFKS